MYINLMTVENKNNQVSIWLLLITFLVGLMIIVGGLTRLTDSGLSITRWDLFKGILPPINSFEWNKAFDLYKKIPEFKLLNYSMSLDEFKVIYWWEYAHRLLGRIIGILYIVPLIYFTFKKYITKKTIFSLYLIFLLICLQGFMGWYMVQSGLTERTDVSHYRLSIHLTLAFIILIMLFWNFLKYKNSIKFYHNKQLPYFLPNLFLFLIILQISIGALVSGLDAGKIYQSWPLMNESYFPNDSSLDDLISLKSFEVPSIVQFIHRNVAYIIFLLCTVILIITFKNKDFFYLRKTTLYIFLLLLLQILLGIFTILSGAQIILASMHQIGSIFLISTSLILVFKNSKIN